MAKFELLNEAEHDKDHNQYLIKVTVDLGEEQTNQPGVHEQAVVLPKKDTDKAAQKYADELESELNKQAEAERKARGDSDEE